MWNKYLRRKKNAKFDVNFRELLLFHRFHNLHHFFLVICKKTEKKLYQHKTSFAEHFYANFLLYILFISKKSYLQHRQSESIINLNFSAKTFVFRSPKNIFFAVIESLKFFPLAFAFKFLFSFFKTKRPKIMKNCTRKIKWMLVFFYLIYS